LLLGERCMGKVGIIEVGSTTTKAKILSEGKLLDKGRIVIPFKFNYSKEGRILESDTRNLIEFINEVKEEAKEVCVFGTSIFRKLGSEEKDEFLKTIKNETGVDFKVVSAEEERDYTVRGVIDGIDYDKKFAVVIGGGGSTEIAVIEHLEVVKKYNLDFGAVDVTESFPSLAEDKATDEIDAMIESILGRLEEIDDKVDTIVLAGGDYIYFYETLGYKMDENFLYEDVYQPYILDFELMDRYDHDMLDVSLDEIRERESAQKDWWSGARGMRIAMNAIARKMDAKYIIPTKINMISGIAKMLEGECNNED